MFAKQFLQCISKAVGPSVEEDSLTLWPAKQTIKLFLGDTLTFAGPLLQAGVIQNCNVAASVVNQSRSLQSACRGCDPARRTPNIMARNSCVSGNSSVCIRSWVNKSQRQHRCSREWNVLQAAD